ncbi:hypothetical protein XA68_14681 [Ophiocordyceps unilateralis]|uniref:Cytochrome P450 n=1 Tax=Ophiocordyceps unilateralis TaxID=268505 RepID=A0A2A9P9V9_OPHUN|nr:hypothetical protein XA68_14681 [Ophiocordyceps unilateralis]
MAMTRLWLALGALLAYLVVRTVYRLCFHPLSSIPGPRLTAATHLYEFLYNVVRPGVFLFEIEAMHRKYGPIVRINPREVHVSDPAFYDVIYASSRRRRDKDPQFVPTYGLPDAMVAAVGHDQHRVRRAVLSDLFSRRAVVERSAVVAERVERLMQRLAEARDAGTVVSLDEAFTAMASDVITAYACGRHWGSLDDEHFRSEVCRATADVMRFAHISRFAPYLVALPRLVSPRAIALLMPAKAALFHHLDAIFDHVRGVRDAPGSSDTVITALTDPSIPPRERSLGRLRDETWAVVGAGTETTARVLTVAAYHLGRNPGLLRKLREELRTRLPESDSTASWAELEKLPYLNGVVHESLRLAYGLTGRLPRVAPTETLHYKGYLIPPGTPMSSSSYIVHRDASVFPNPERYDPERWLRASDKGDNLKRYLTSFSKGILTTSELDSLAYMELFLTIGHLARRFDLELHDTGPEDVRIVRDMNMGLTRRGAVRVFARMAWPSDDV